MVGNGSSLLAQTGALYHRKIADFPADKNWNRMFTAGMERITEAKVVMDGKFYSCRDTMSGIDMTLWLIADQIDISVAQQAAESMGYVWSADADTDIYC